MRDTVGNENEIGEDNGENAQKVYHPSLPIPSGKPSGKRLAVLQNVPGSPTASVVSSRSSSSHASRSTKRSMELDDSEAKRSRTSKASTSKKKVNGTTKRKTKSKVKTTHTVDPTSTSNVGQVTEDEYIVEKVVSKKFVDEVPYYFIKWKGWASAHNTWEPIQNLEGCPELVDKFEKMEKERKSRPKSTLKVGGGKGSEFGSARDDESDIDIDPDEDVYDHEEEMKKTQAELIEYGIHDSWPTHRIPNKLVGIVDVDKHLTYLVHSRPTNLSLAENENKIDANLDELTSETVIVVRAAAFRTLFPHIVIDFYQKQLLWLVREETPEELITKAAEAVRNIKTSDELSTKATESVRTNGTSDKLITKAAESVRTNGTSKELITKPAKAVRTNGASDELITKPAEAVRTNETSDEFITKASESVRTNGTSDELITKPAESVRTNGTSKELITKPAKAVRTNGTSDELIAKPAEAVRTNETSDELIAKPAEAVRTNEDNEMEIEMNYI